MLELRIKDTSGIWQSLDLFENEPISIEYAVRELQDVSQPVGSFSQSFRIPASDRNISVFGGLFDPNYIGEYLVKRKSEAQILESGIPLLVGHLQMKQSIIHKGHFAEFEVVVFGEVVDFGRSVGDVNISDLLWADLQHDISYSNIVQSWSGNLLGGAVRYGIIDRGNMGWGIGGNSAAQENALLPKRLVPFVRLKSFIDKIFQKAGYEYESAFFTSALADMYVPAYVGGNEINIGTNVWQNAILAGLLADYQVSTGGDFVLPIADTPAPFYDNPSEFDNTTREWTSNYTGFTTAVLNLNMACNTFIEGQFILVKAYIDEYVGGTLFESVQLGTYLLSYEDPEVSTTDTAILSVQDGAKYKLRVSVENGTSNTLTFVGDGITGGCSIYYLLQGQVSNTLCDISQNLPEYKAIDFINDVQKMFNLVFEPDKNNSKVLKVEPASDYFGTGVIRDWTDKVDYDTDVVIKPTTDDQSRVYEWMFAEADDIVNDAYVNSANRVFGRYRILDTENDFATGDETVEVGFAPFVVNTQSGKTLFRGHTDDLEPISDALPMVCYWNGMQSGSWYLFNGNTPTLQNTYPVFSQFTTTYASFDDDALQFGTDSAHNVQALPVNTLYTKYWEQYVVGLYSEESRVMECDVLLHPSDIATISFADLVRTREGVWRVLTIAGYVANDMATCSVTLLKWFGDVEIPRCTHRPHSVTTGGIVFFEDAEGNTGLTGTQQCCEAYGYQWTGTFCLGRPSSPTSGGASGGSSLVLGMFSGVLTPQDLQETNENLSSFVDETTDNFTETNNTISNTELFVIFMEK